MEKIDMLSSSVQVFHSLHSVPLPLMRPPDHFIFLVRLLCPSPFGGHPIPPRFRSHCEARSRPQTNVLLPASLLSSPSRQIAPPPTARDGGERAPQL